MKNERQIELIEEVMKKAHQEQVTPEIPADWQGAVMAAIQQEAKAEDSIIDRTETIMFRVAWVAAGIAAVLVLMFGLFFSPITDEDSIEDDLQNLYVDTVTSDLLTINSQ